MKKQPSEEGIKLSKYFSVEEKNDHLIDIILE